MAKRKRKLADRAGSQDVAARVVSIQRIGVAAAIGLLVLMAAALILSALTASGMLPAVHMRIYAGVAVFLGGLVCAVVAGGSKRKLLSALLASMVLLATLLIIGTALFSGLFMTKNFFIVLIILLISCMMGSVISTAIH